MRILSCTRIRPSLRRLVLVQTRPDGLVPVVAITLDCFIRFRVISLVLSFLLLPEFVFGAISGLRSGGASSVCRDVV